MSQRRLNPPPDLPVLLTWAILTGLAVWILTICGCSRPFCQPCGVSPRTVPAAAGPARDRASVPPSNREPIYTPPIPGTGHVADQTPRPAPAAGGTVSAETAAALNAINDRVGTVQEQTAAAAQRAEEAWREHARLAALLEQSNAALLSAQNAAAAATHPAPAIDAAAGTVAQVTGEAAGTSWLTPLLVALGVSNPWVLAAGTLLPIVGGAAGWVLRRRRERRGTPGATVEITSPDRSRLGPVGNSTLADDLERVREGGRADAAIPRPLPPRDTAELEQLLRLRRLEGRDPLLDAAFGMFVEDEAEKVMAAGGECAGLVTALVERATARLRQIAPLSIKPPAES